MIEIDKLTSDDIGKWVEYHSYNDIELGKIKSWNDYFIFVVYNCADLWDRYQDYTAAATRPKDLKYKK